MNYTIAAALLAQTKEALDAAAQAERLGLIGVLAAFVIASGFIIWRLVASSLTTRDDTIQRLIKERNDALRRERELHVFVETQVAPQIGDATKLAALLMRRVVDDETE